MIEKMSQIGQQCTRFIGRTGLKLKKYSPEMLLVVGVGAVIGGTVMACKATLNVKEIEENNEELRNAIEEARETNPEEYTEESYKKDKAIVTGKLVHNYIVNYGPSVLVMSGGVICIIMSHGILMKRNAAIAAAYEAVVAGFKSYRENVRNHYGEDVDRRLLHGLEIADKELAKKSNGEIEAGEEYFPAEKSTMPSPYAKFFDESSIYWEKNPEYNLMFLHQVQEYLNDRLRSWGHVFLNEAYDALGLPRTTAGCVVGWMLDGDNSDGYIDLGIYNIKRESSRDFVNGYERSILLDFNCDGDISKMI